MTTCRSTSMKRKSASLRTAGSNDENDGTVVCWVVMYVSCRCFLTSHCSNFSCKIKFTHCWKQRWKWRWYCCLLLNWLGGHVCRMQVFSHKLLLQLLSRARTAAPNEENDELFHELCCAFQWFASQSSVQYKIHILRVNNCYCAKRVKKPSAGAPHMWIIHIWLKTH